MEAKKQDRPHRVAIVAIQHESNTFIPRETTLADFTVLKGEQVRELLENAHHEVSGFFQKLKEEGMEAVPILMANTGPSGVINDETLDALWKMAEEGILAAGPLDGVLAAPHGAAVNQSRADMDGWWLSKVRQLVGKDVPIIATIDPHANLGRAMITACDAIIAYRENPHLDQKQRGMEAAGLMARAIRGEIHPVNAAAYPDICINIERQYSYGEPILSVKRKLDEVRGKKGVLSASLVLGFPYADVPEMGSSFIVVTDKDAKLAETLSQELADWLVEHREDFRGDMISAEEAFLRIEKQPKPVGLLDMGDNNGGGAPGDSTLLAHQCHKEGKFRAFVCLMDPDSEKIARQAGVGKRVTLEMGGKKEVSPAPPLKAEVTVVSVHEGSYRETQPRHGGKIQFDMGPTTVVRTDTHLTVMLTAKRAFPASIQQLLSCGVEPKDFDIIIIKGVHAPMGAYAEVCPSMIRVNTAGVTTADMATLKYQHRRKPLFPFED